jgi:hypothetical protein
MASAAADNAGKPPGGTKISEVDFPISCSAPAQKKFNQAVWILHSFWYEEAVKAFTDVTAIEPECAMGYWGVAMSHWYPLWYPPNPAALKAGSEAVEKAMAAKQKTDRESDYIAAIAAFYRDNDKVDHRTRAIAYEKEMEQVHLRYPDDREAGVFYSLALVATAPPTDKTYANQKKARAILETVRAEQPNHPGVAHYLIHANDSAEMAEDELTPRSATPTSRRQCRMPCICRHTSSRGWVCGGNRSTPTGLRQLPHSPMSGRSSAPPPSMAKPSIRWTIWNMRICRWVRIATQSASSMSC